MTGKSLPFSSFVCYDGGNTKDEVILMAISQEYLALHSLWEKAVFGSYLIVPLKYDEGGLKTDYIRRVFTPMMLTTTDIGENIKDMINRPGPGNIGQAYSIPREALEQEMLGGHFERMTAREGDHEGSFSLMDSYLYVFHTQVAFLCLDFAYEEMATLYHICNPGFVQMSSEFKRWRPDGEMESFSLEDALCALAERCGMRKFFDGVSPAIVESYVYNLAVVPERFPSMEVMRQATFNMHLMTDLNAPAEDESEEDLRYVYAVKTQSLGSYRWGCCVSSQTINYVQADAEMNLARQMDIQAEDGLPVVMLALYEKFTCLRFTELLSQSMGQDARHLDGLKKMMLKFQAYGTVTPSNLSRWHNVKHIYAALLEVNDTATAVSDIDAKLSILTAQQQDIEQRKTDTVTGIITLFGVVSIVESMLSIVEALSGGAPIDLMTVGGTLLTLGVVTAVMLKLLKRDQ